MYCTNCGTPFDSDKINSKCPKCGKLVEQKNPPQPASWKAPWWLKTVASLLLVGILYLGGKALFSEDITEVVKDQLDAIRTDRITEAYYGYTSHEFQKLIPLETFRDFINHFPALKRNQSIEIETSEHEGPTGFLRGKIVTKDNVEVPVEYQLVREDDKWKILTFKFPEIAQATANGTEYQGPIVDKSEYDDLLLPIKSELKALHDNDIEKSYHGVVSEEFEKNTPFNKYEEFVKQYPVFTDYSKFEIRDKEIDGDKGSVILVLTDKNENPFPVEYNLLKEDGQWKIWSIRLVIAKSDDLDNTSGELTRVIQEQLDAVYTGDIKHAYKDLTSEEFKQATPFDQFEKIVASFPAFHENVHISGQNLTFYNNVAIFTGNLTANNEKFPFEYDFVKENDEWRIVFMKVSSDNALKDNNQPAIAKPEGDKPTGNISFDKLLIGNQVDNNGLVADPKDTLQSNGGDIYGNLYIQSGNKGDQVELVLRHKESNSNVAPVLTKLPNDGENVLSYMFSPPAEGWPTGSYEVVVTSGEISKTFNFTVE